MSGSGPSGDSTVADVVVVVGATGTGKSGLALDLAEGLSQRGRRAEVVNADAMQLYRGMDIGTAKLPPDERRGIPHHLLDVLDVTQENSVADFQASARAEIDAILERGNVPILVGGSGLYVSSVIFDFDFPGTDAAIRARLEAELIADGPGSLYRRLKERDEAAAAAIGSQNGRRLVRALEVFEMTGRTLTGTLPGAPVEWRSSTIIALEMPRPDLVARLDERVVGMWRDGIVEEAAALRSEGLSPLTTAGKAIGYAQALAQLAGGIGVDEAIESTQALTRRYARRQVGWFKRYASSVTVDARDPDAPARALSQTLGLHDGD
ncbi:tRNA (adenosine(37)-N6)-dimethylallyltransferase MiaA [Agreia bicolorata]|uniref:tRNA (adenosine(37)-N6)-dimethylallyltransferase MiaA n=1 Tax=Agreia bicolorata TaxID=110935 RepID=UPI0005C8E5FC|nr:tRNA (adenosine(37)-N6)-dimethylallyltransferase MiaA [Agreia bicolorata]